MSVTNLILIGSFHKPSYPLNPVSKIVRPRALGLLSLFLMSVSFYTATPLYSYHHALCTPPSGYVLEC
jgi:hypothetical protein